jgi:hypothetical protein
MHEDKRLIVILNFEVRLLCMLATAFCREISVVDRIFLKSGIAGISEYREFEAWIKVYADDCTQHQIVSVAYNNL